MYSTILAPILFAAFVAITDDGAKNRFIWVGARLNVTKRFCSNLDWSSDSRGRLPEESPQDRDSATVRWGSTTLPNCLDSDTLGELFSGGVTVCSVLIGELGRCFVFGL